MPCRATQGDRDAQSFAGQVDEVMRAHAGTNRRLAVDKIQIHGLRALERAGFEVMEGEELTERTRAIKGPDEILAMRCAHHACEAAIAEMEDFTRTNVPNGGMSAKTTSGPSCTRATSGAAANGSKPGYWPPAPAPIRGFRNAGRGSCSRMKSSLSTPT